MCKIISFNLTLVNIKHEKMNGYYSSNDKEKKKIYQVK